MLRVLLLPFPTSPWPTVSPETRERDTTRLDPEENNQPSDFGLGFEIFNSPRILRKSRLDLLSRNKNNTGNNTFKSGDVQGRFIYLGKSLSINCNYVPYYVGNGLGLKREGFCRGFAPLSIITRQGYFQLNGAPPPRIPRHTTPARFNETWSVLPWLNPCHPFSSSFLPFRVRPPPFLSYYLEKLKLDSHGLTFRFSLLPLANRKIRPATG